MLIIDASMNALPYMYCCLRVMGFSFMFTIMMHACYSYLTYFVYDAIEYCLLRSLVCILIFMYPFFRRFLPRVCYVFCLVPCRSGRPELYAEFVLTTTPVLLIPLTFLVTLQLHDYLCELYCELALLVIGTARHSASTNLFSTSTHLHTQFSFHVVRHRDDIVSMF